MKRLLFSFIGNLLMFMFLKDCVCVRERRGALMVKDCVCVRERRGALIEGCL
jgi:hypothetical protein